MSGQMSFLKNACQLSNKKTSLSLSQIQNIYKILKTSILRLIFQKSIFLFLAKNLIKSIYAVHF